MDKLYYLQYYELERNHWWFRARSKILRNYIGTRIHKKAPLDILNAGVATGASSLMLQEFGEVTSLEYEKDCIEFIKDKVPLQVDHGSVLALPYADKSFDLVCVFDVIEHVEDDQLAVNELIRVCRPGGSVLVTVPAFRSLWSEHDEVNHHFRRYTRDELRRLFAQQPGREEYASYFNFWLFPSILLARQLGNLFRSAASKPKSDFERFRPGLMSDVLYQLMASEKYALIGQLPLPWGVSVLLHFKKDE